MSQSFAISWRLMLQLNTNFWKSTTFWSGVNMPMACISHFQLRAIQIIFWLIWNRGGIHSSMWVQNRIVSIIIRIFVIFHCYPACNMINWNITFLAYLSLSQQCEWKVNVFSLVVTICDMAVWQNCHTCYLVIYDSSSIYTYQWIIFANITHKKEQTKWHLK